MASLSIHSSVDYAKTLLPESWVRSVSTIQTTLSRRILPPPKPRPFRLCTQSRKQRKGVVAASLDDLLDQTASAFLLTCQFLILVLEEDGTVVDSEAFFQSLPANTPVMVLQEGEMWTRVLPSSSQPKRNGIGKLSFDLYKLNPKDFIGCLTIKATLYEIYTLSYDVQCTRAKGILKSLLRYLTCVARVAGQLLLCGSSYILQYIGNDDY
ncbi:cell death activator CIDE-A [Salmo salar]|uniref:Cell death activator CIDE-A n=1 Tax=Salmo salar TaxID=8030 RepID=A0A1S3Q872_SALSA|nr:cell death activator CIDE-A [Salmo salar]|eukprot:XP_014036107.1 PREDICTED: cell death activator CIDE-A-like [Salmo salar]